MVRKESDGGYYCSVFQCSRHLPERDIDTAKFGVDLHQHIECKPTVLSLATDIELVDTLRCDPRHGITVALDRDIHLTGFGGRNNHEQLDLTTTLESRHDILLKTSDDLVACPIHVCKLFHRIAVDDGHPLVLRRLAERLDENIKITVHFIAPGKDKNAPVLECGPLTSQRGRWRW